MNTKSFIFLTLLISISAFAQVPETIFYQGKLTSTTGIGVNDTIPFTFRLYDEETDGAPLWTEHHFAVPVVKGLFDVMLGSINPIGLEFDRQYWLEMTVDGNLLTPRSAFSTSPYAFRAKYADSVGTITVNWGDIEDIPPTFADGFISWWEIVGIPDYVRDSTPDYDTSPTNELIWWIEYDLTTDTLWFIEGSSNYQSVHIPTIKDLALHSIFELGDVDSTGGMTGPLLVWDGTKFVFGGMHWNDIDDIPADVESLAIGRLGVDTLWTRSKSPDDTLVVAANLKVDGDGIIDGDLSVSGDLDVGGIVGQGKAFTAVAGVTDLAPIGTDITLANLTYGANGSGSTIFLTFDGVFDDLGGLNGASIIVELVRNPGGGEVIVAQTELFVYHNDFHVKKPVTLNGLDEPPAGIHSYEIRARSGQLPFDGGRCVSGKLILSEIKG